MNGAYCSASSPRQRRRCDHEEGNAACDEDLSEASLSEACPWQACLDVANLRSTALVGVHLAWASLVRTGLVCASLHGADLTGANLNEATLSGGKLMEANLSGVNLSAIKWDIT